MINALIQPMQYFASETTEEKVGGIASLGVDFKTLILQIITFLIVFALLKKFAFPKIVATLDERRETIDAGVHLGQQLRKEKELLDSKVEEVLQSARVNADKIINDSKQEAANVIKEAEQAASSKVDAMLQDAKIRLEKDIQHARNNMEQELVSLVAGATEKIIGEKLDASKDAKLIETYLAEVKQS